jgi:uncharacterized protein YndB with AHSA1/START domain
MASLIATAQIDIAAPAEQVWKALTDPALIAEYFFGTHVDTDWQPGSPITWTGDYQGNAYEDKGEVIAVQLNRRLQVTHFSPMTGLPDEPKNYHTLTYELDDRGYTTHLSLSQDNNGDEAEAQRATENWTMMLAGLKKTVEGI